MQEIEIAAEIKHLIGELSETPTEQIRKIGEALVSIADALEGKTREEAQRIMNAFYALEGQ